ADLLRVCLRQRAAEHREVLREDIDQATADPPVAGHDAVPVRMLPIETEVGRAVRDEPVELHEAAFVQQHIEALASRELPLVVLRLEALLPAPELGQRALPVEVLQLLSHG